ncbi:DUF3775 domain-containing protein [Chromobacterium paludis]|uniref:DUF3775 domain-containing protein n=1 Tax=Chromobacterium paludis TaxID=2605945 RepID=A0A5C1DH01_9NEIS|nr:DUF3775 domain-containing protein [Chromobacterium paludis]QEL56040.1 DUF3775 domain-containing protein [Chromobacterium paludis]
MNKLRVLLASPRLKEIMSLAERRASDAGPCQSISFGIGKMPVLPEEKQSAKDLDNAIANLTTAEAYDFIVLMYLGRDELGDSTVPQMVDYLRGLSMQWDDNGVRASLAEKMPLAVYLQRGIEKVLSVS